MENIEEFKQIILELKNSNVNEKQSLLDYLLYMDLFLTTNFSNKIDYSLVKEEFDSYMYSFLNDMESEYLILDKMEKYIGRLQFSSFESRDDYELFINVIKLLISTSSKRKVECSSIINKYVLYTKTNSFNTNNYKIYKIDHLGSKRYEDILQILP